MPFRPLPPSLHLPLALAALAGMLMAAGSLLMPDQYRCEARILPDDGHASLPWRAGVWAPTAAPEPPGNREDGPTVVYADILKSRRVAEVLLRARYDYAARAWKFGPARPRRGTLLDYLGADHPDRALGGFRRLFTVERNPKTGLLTLAAETRSPDLSLQVAQRAVAELRTILVEFGQAQGRSRARTAGDRLEEARAAYAQRAETFRRFQEANRAWESSPAPNLRFQGGQLRDDLALWRRVVENLTLQHQQALLEAGNDAQTLLVLDPGVLPRAKSGPHRALMVLGAMAAAGAAAWAAMNPLPLRDLFLAKEHP